MELLKDNGAFDVLVEWPSNYTNHSAQLIIEKAGRTCYQSEKHPITAESAQTFCSKILDLTHLSVIGHGWRGYIIHELPFCDVFSIIVKRFWPVSKFLFITSRADGSILVSANLETWRKMMHMNLEEFSKDIVNDLLKFAPAIFAKDFVPNRACDVSFAAQPIKSTNQLLTANERLIHIAHTVQYIDNSRACINELERHQGPIYSQESTRYVDESNLRVVIPPHRNELYVDHDGRLLSIANFFNDCENTYKSLRVAGWAKEDARQMLPNGIVAETVMSCNLQERRYIYFRRMDFNAHWEIRKLMISEFLHFKNCYPELFDMFEYQDKPAKDGIVGYYTVKDPSLFYNMRQE
jgi:thymidylate synthase ThyX